MTFLLAVCMAVSLLAVPAGAANTAAVTFSDVGDKSTAVAVESLRLLGVLDGYGDGTFRPGTVLTRAQFCKMAVYAMNGSNELGRYRTVTVFSDVKPSYWAAPYINMAAKGKNIISGYADGKFHPDRTVTVGQAVTILLRMLGYSDKTGDFEISDAAAFAWRIGLTGRQLIGILSMGDLAEAIYDALDFCYKGTETTVLSRLMDLGVCTASAANALGLLNKDYTARQLADRYLSAAFQLSLYETEEQVHDEVSSADASGFFISADGLAVTNYHSIEDSIKATATLLNGETYEVERVLYYDTGIDIAVIKVSRTNQSRRTTSAFNHLDLVGTADIRPGDPVYAIGNPLGLGLAISSGIIGSTAHELDRYALPCIVNSADISRGSSGGALMNAHGQVIGVTSGAYTYGNNMYLAVPVDPVMAADLTVSGWTLKEVKAIEAAKDKD